MRTHIDSLLSGGVFTLVAFCALFLPTYLTAQTTVTVSSEIAAGAGTDYFLVGKVRDSILVILNEGNELHTVTFDADLTNKRTATIKPERQHHIKLLETVQGKECFAVVYSYSELGVGQRTKLARLNTDGQLRDSLTLQAFASFINNYTPETVVSENRQYLAVYSVENDDVRVAVANLATMTRTEHTFARLGSRSSDDFLQVLLDNNGGVYVVEEKDNRKGRISTNRLEVTYHLPENPEDWTVKLALTGKLWQDVRFVVDNRSVKGGRLLGGGFFSPRWSSESEGSFFAAVTPFATVPPVLVFEEYGNDFMQQIIGKPIRNRNTGFTDLKVTDLIPRGDGGFLLVSEARHVVAHTPPTTGYAAGFPRTDLGRVEKNYDYDELLLVAYHPDGTIHWKELLQKRQSTRDDDARYSSYCLLRTKTALHFMYNDEVGSTSSSNIVEYAVETDGTARRRSLFNAEKFRTDVLLREAKQISAGEVVVPAYRRGVLTLVKVQLK